MSDKNQDIKGAKFEDSNLANYGSKEHHDLRKKAAESEKEYKGSGEKVGLEIWRVENKRTADDKPDFGVKRWPAEEYGSFYSGDSYLLLNTYKVVQDGKVTDKLAWDIHFWLGEKSSQDEIGVAAYKAVELDDLLDDKAAQHREMQGNESPLFQSYFKHIHIMEGGIGSGFRHVKPDEYVSRLFQVKRSHKVVRVSEVPCKATSLNDGDVSILDAGTSVYLYVGSSANPFEKARGGNVVESIISGREGKSSTADVDDLFWKILGGSAKDVQPATAEEKLPDPSVTVFRLSDTSGKLKFEKVATGPTVSGKTLDSRDVFIVDNNISVFIWIGKGSSKVEKSNAMQTADKYLADTKRPRTTPISRIYEGQVNSDFGSCFKD